VILNVPIEEVTHRERKINTN